MNPDTSAHQVFTDEDFRFRLGTELGSIEDFFALSVDATSILAERREWLTQDPDRYVVLLPECEPIADELVDVASGWDIFRKDVPFLAETLSVSRLVGLCCRLEPDLVLLRPGPDEQFVVAGGCVCFPSSWRLTDKIGQPVSQVHDPVPGLNDVLGRQIDRLIWRLKPGKCILRANWGVCCQPDLNQHPDRNLPSLALPGTFDNCWLRREDQCLFALPKTGGVVFGIRVTHVSWRDLRANPMAARSVARGLRTMSPEMRSYKRLSDVYRDLADLLEQP